MIVHGGIDANGVVLSDTWMYNLELRNWSRLYPTNNCYSKALSHFGMC